jgi:hypothetical protein
MFGFLLGLGAGALCVLNPEGTRRLLATLIVKGQDAASAIGHEAVRWSARVGEEIEDIVAEAKAAHDQKH